MSRKSVNCNTPKNTCTRRLSSLRSGSRSISKTAPKLTVPQSDEQINYKTLEEPCKPVTKSTKPLELKQEEAAATPCSSSSLVRQTAATTSCCRPYRLSLSKRIREKMTKKRLEFHLANDLEKDDYNVEQTKHQLTTAQTLNATEDNDEIQYNADTTNEIIECERQAIEKHNKLVTELNNTIAMWKIAFCDSLDELQLKLEHKMEKSELLEKLRIPQEMLKYVDD